MQPLASPMAFRNSSVSGFAFRRNREHTIPPIDEMPCKTTIAVVGPLCKNSKHAKMTYPFIFANLYPTYAQSIGQI